MVNVPLNVLILHTNGTNNKITSKYMYSSLFNYTTKEEYNIMTNLVVIFFFVLIM